MRLSIITLTLDSSPYLEEAIASVEHHDALEVEHIIVHDGRESVARELKSAHPGLIVLLGRGAGATAAAVAGVEAATGDFILLLHSDDRLASGALARFVACATARPDADMWTGGIRFFERRDGSEVTVRCISKRGLTSLTLANICNEPPLLTARFCRRSLFATLGNFDVAFSESSDREFLIRAVLSGVTDEPLEVIVSEMRMHEDSRTLHGKSGVVPAYLVEHIRISEMWLARPDLERKRLRVLRNWRAREILRLIVLQARAQHWGKAAHLLLRTALSDPTWCLRSISILWVQLRRRTFRMKCRVSTGSAGRNP